MQRDAATLLDIADAARSIGEFIEDMDQAAFLNDRKTQSAVLHQLLVLGEAVKRLSPEFRASHPDIPWTSAARMRDYLIHSYDNVELDIVWDTITQNVPALLVRVTPLLPQTPPA